MDGKFLIPGTIKQGYLTKAPPLDKNTWTTVFKGWRKRWCILYLSGKELFMQYYEDEESARGSSPPKSTISLRFCDKVDVDLEHSNYKNVFSVRLPERIYYFAAPSHFEMNEWADAICAHLSFGSSNMTRSTSPGPGGFSHNSLSSPGPYSSTMQYESRTLPATTGQYGLLGQYGTSTLSGGFGPSGYVSPSGYGTTSTLGVTVSPAVYSASRGPVPPPPVQTNDSGNHSPALPPRKIHTLPPSSSSSLSPTTSSSTLHGSISAIQHRSLPPTPPETVPPHSAPPIVPERQHHPLNSALSGPPVPPRCHGQPNLYTSSPSAS